jgi:hypothetical protein
MLFCIPAEREGFEPPDLLQSTVFKTAAIDRSAISPRSKLYKRVDFQKRIFNCATYFFVESLKVATVAGLDYL